MTQEATLSVAASPAQAEAVAKFVRELCAGFIECGEGTRLKVRPPFDFSIKPVPHGLRITIADHVLIERAGIDPWLQHVDLCMDGRIVAVVKAFGIVVEREV